MYIPCARETVHVAGRPELFFVLTVYLKENFADLVPLNGAAYIERSVPFSALELHSEGRKDRKYSVSVINPSRISGGLM